MTFDNDTLWRAVERLARRNALSVSQLLLRAELRFNSRRNAWLSSRTIAKLLVTYDIDIVSFITLGQEANILGFLSVDDWKHYNRGHDNV